MDHIGIDVHKRESQICIRAEGGELIEQRIRTEPERFAAVLGPRPRARILIEASTDSEWVARCLEQLGHEVIVADPNFAPMYATRTRRIKTDRRDARALADANLLGAYRPAHRLSDAQRQVRGRLGVREALVRTRTRYIALIRALLRQHGYRVPSGGAETFIARVAAMPLPGHLRSLIAPLLAVMLPLNRQLAYADEVIDHLAAHDPRIKRLRTVPSIGPVIAAAFVASLDNAQRFHHAHQVEAYLGLVPRECSSGDTRRRGPITKAGPGRARWLLIQALVSILRCRPAEAEALHTWALHIAARRGTHVAVVALARRLAGILYALLRDGSVFQPRPTRGGCDAPAVPAVPRRHADRAAASSGAAARPTEYRMVILTDHNHWLTNGPIIIIRERHLGLSQVRRVGERECALWPLSQGRCTDGAPPLESPYAPASVSSALALDERE